MVAGANGSGKSTLYDRTDIEGFGRSVWIINPDTLSARIARQEHIPLLAANGSGPRSDLGVARRVDPGASNSRRREVLSTDKYRALAGRAKALGFEIRLLYVFLRTADMNVARVKLRVEKGGHAVEESKIRARRERSFAQLPWFLDQADVALIYDNSGAQPRLVAEKSAGAIALDPSAPDPIRQAVESLGDVAQP